MQERECEADDEGRRQCIVLIGIGPENYWAWWIGEPSVRRNRFSIFRAEAEVHPHHPAGHWHRLFIMNVFGKRNATLSATNLSERTSDNEGVMTGGKKQRDDDDDGLEFATIAKKFTETESNQHQQQEQTADIEEEIVSDTRKNSLNADPLIRIVSTVLPKVEPLPWSTFFCLSIWCTVPWVLFCRIYFVTFLAPSQTIQLDIAIALRSTFFYLRCVQR